MLGTVTKRNETRCRRFKSGVSLKPLIKNMYQSSGVRLPSAGRDIPQDSVLNFFLRLSFVNGHLDVLESKVMLFADVALLISPRSDLNIRQHCLRAAWS